MTLNLASILPEDLTRRLEEAASARSLSGSDFVSLLLGSWTRPEWRLSEECVVRDLADELLIHFGRRAEALRNGSGGKPRSEEVTAELKAWRPPQSLDELKPALQPPPGQTIRDMMPREPWPGEETDQELLASLREMDANPKPSPEQLDAELRAWRTPQTLDELKPREPAPPGMTAMQFIEGKWPGDETEEELLASLKAMDVPAPKPSRQELSEQLRAGRTPQSREELRPRAPAPPGMTAMQFIRGHWPGDETDTDEEILAALKEMG